MLAEKSISVKGEFYSGNTKVLKADVSISKGEFVCVIGKVGSGKSSLLSAILGELICSEGGVMITSDVSYAS